MHNDNSIKSKGKLSAVGLGPGDPDLLTIKAVKLLERADVVLTPKAAEKEKSIAKEIISHAVKQDLNYFELPYTMTRSKEERESYWNETAKEVLSFIEEGKDVVFTTLGDLSLYSTFQYFRNSWKMLNTGIPIFTVPGISSFQAGASSLGKDLALGKDSFCVTPLPEKIENLDYFLDMHSTVVIMKVGKNLNKLIAYLKSKDLLSSSGFVSRVTMDNEVKYISMEEMTEKTEGYLSTVLVNRGAGK